MSLTSGNLILMDEIITTAASSGIKNTVTGLIGITSCIFQCIFKYGGALDSPTATVYIQTSLDSGKTWFDIANFAQAQVSLSRVMSINSATVRSLPFTATDGTLPNNTAQSGMIGDRLRVKFVSTGTYTNDTTCKVVAIVS